MRYFEFLIALAPVVSGRLIKEQVEAYQKLVGTDRLTSDGLLKLLKLHDDDTICVNSCARYVSELVGGEVGMV